MGGVQHRAGDKGCRERKRSELGAGDGDGEAEGREGDGGEEATGERRRRGEEATGRSSVVAMAATLKGKSFSPLRTNGRDDPVVPSLWGFGFWNLSTL